MLHSPLLSSPLLPSSPLLYSPSLLLSSPLLPSPPTPLSQTCTANYTFIPYMVTPHNKVYCCESSLLKGLTELMQPNFEALLGPICLPLVDRLTHLLKIPQANSW